MHENGFCVLQKVLQIWTKILLATDSRVKAEQVRKGESRLSDLLVTSSSNRFSYAVQFVCHCRHRLMSHFHEELCLRVCAQPCVLLQPRQRQMGWLPLVTCVCSPSERSAKRSGPECLWGKYALKVSAGLLVQNPCLKPACRGYSGCMSVRLGNSRVCVT